jgi:ABC-type tungstate transport system substrate-binding protein
MFTPDGDAFSSNGAVISRAASLGTLGCVVVIAAGILGQIVLTDPISSIIVTAFGLAALASMVLAHQR